MKRKAIKDVVLFLLLFAGTLSAQELKGPRIEVKQEQYAVGNVAQGEQAVHVFEVRNAGTEPLMIERVQPS
jgi:Protein of unknown function (DUF1573)